MTKVLCINNGYPSNRYPNYTTYIKSIEDCLTCAGIEVEHIVISYNRQILIPYKLLKYVTFWINLYSVQLYNYDYIYINHPPFSWPIFFNRTFENERVVLHWHGNDVVGKGIIQTLFSKLLKSKCREMKSIVPSLYFKSVVEDKLKIPANQIVVSPSGGVDTELFCPIPKQIKDSNTIVLGYASGMSRCKGANTIMWLVDHCKEIEANLSCKILFHIIDTGSEIEMYREKLLASPNVVLISKMPKCEMPAYYNNLDVLLMSSNISESLGLVVLEALSCGKPAICFNLFAFPEFVIPGKTGELVDYSLCEEENCRGFIKAIVRCLLNKEKYSTRDIIMNSYSKATVINQYKNIFKYVNNDCYGENLL